MFILNYFCIRHFVYITDMRVDSEYFLYNNKNSHACMSMMWCWIPFFSQCWHYFLRLGKYVCSISIMMILFLFLWQHSWCIMIIRLSNAILRWLRNDVFWVLMCFSFVVGGRDLKIFIRIFLEWFWLAWWFCSEIYTRHCLVTFKVSFSFMIHRQSWRKICGNFGIGHKHRLCTFKNLFVSVISSKSYSAWLQSLTDNDTDFWFKYWVRSKGCLSTCCCWEWLSLRLWISFIKYNQQSRGPTSKNFAV